MTTTTEGSLPQTEPPLPRDQIHMVGVLSDTHGYLDPQIFTLMEACEEIWHAGDFGSWEVYSDLITWKGKERVRAVFGNIDGWDLRRELPEDLIFSFAGMRILLTHIGGEPPRYSGRILPYLNRGNIQMLVCGHTHVLKVSRDSQRNLWYINPGAAGNYGPQPVRTALRLYFSRKEPRLLHVEVLELGRR